MSEPTYRIEITHDPQSKPGRQWDWRVYTVAELGCIASGFWHTSRHEAAEAARVAIVRHRDQLAAVTLYATEDGEIMDGYTPQVTA